MANAVYASALAAFAGGEIDWASDTIKVALLEGYTYNAAHDFYNDVSGDTVGTPTTIPGRTIVGGDLKATPVTLTSVPPAHTVDSYVVFKDTGVSVTSRLVAFLDTQADTTPINVATDGGNVVIDWSLSTVPGRVVKL